MMLLLSEIYYDTNIYGYSTRPIAINTDAILAINGTEESSLGYVESSVIHLNRKYVEVVGTVESLMDKIQEACQ